MNGNETAGYPPELAAKQAEKYAYDQSMLNQGKLRNLGEALDVPPCARQSLLESILSRSGRAQTAKYEAEKLARLLYLCDKNPEVFEMISLLRDLNFIA